MPLYEYVCQDCDAQAEILVQGSQQPECPKCGSAKLTKLLSVVAAPGRDASAGELAAGAGRVLRFRLRLPPALDCPLQSVCAACAGIGPEGRRLPPSQMWHGHGSAGASPSLSATAEN